jgi:CRP-like cAMP-binding protein
MSAQNPTISVLSQIAPFDRVPPREMRELATHVDHIRVGAGSVLAREGATAREFIVVLSGDVLASRADSGGDRLGVGTRIGADALTEHRPHDRTWRAVTDVELLVVNGPAFRFASSSRIAA